MDYSGSIFSSGEDGVEDEKVLGVPTPTLLDCVVVEVGTPTFFDCVVVEVGIPTLLD